MKTVLWISSSFPPKNNPASIRSLKLTKYLPHYGWKAIVVCPKFKFAVHPGERMKESIRSDIPSENEVILAGFDPYELLQTKSQEYRIPFYHLLTPIALPDRNLLWCLAGYTTIKEILKQKKVDAVLTTCPPFSLNYLGIWLKRAYRIPWVTDFRDLWTINPFVEKVIFHSRVWSKIFERVTMRECNGFVANTPSSLKRMIAKYKQVDGKGIVISNGYDPEEVGRALRSQQRVNPRTIFFGGDIYRGKEGYDPRFLIRILKRCTDRGFIGPSWEFHYAGPESERLRALVEKGGLSINTITHGYLQTPDYLSLMSKMGVVMLSLPAGLDTRSWIPARVYDYMGMKTKIFCITNSGSELSRVLEAYGRSLVCHYGDELNGITKEFEKFCLMRTDELPFSQVFVGTFSRKAQACSLATFLTKLIN